MLRLGKLTDYATVLMTALAADPDFPHSAQELAERSHVAVPTVRKLLKLLTKAGLVDSLRGARGGYRLARHPAEITVADIVAALEGPLGVTECATHAGGCSLESHCGVRTNWRLINHAIQSALEAVSLAQMATPRGPAPRELPLLQMPRAGASK